MVRFKGYFFAFSVLKRICSSIFIAILDIFKSITI